MGRVSKKRKRKAPKPKNTAATRYRRDGIAEQPPVGRTEAPVRLRSGIVIPGGSAVYPVSEAETRELNRMRAAGLARDEGQPVRLRRPRPELPPLILSAPGGLT